MALPNLRPLSFGEILDSAFTLYRRNFATFIATTLIPVVVMFATFMVLGRGVLASMATGDPGAMVGAAIGSVLVIGLVAFVVVLLMWGALVREAAQAYTGQPTSVADGLQAGLGAVLPLFGAAFVAGLGVVVAGVGVVIALALFMGVLAMLGGVFALLGTLLALAAWFGFFLVAMAVLFAVVPAVVVERAGPIQALERSFTLARGALGRVIGLMLVTFLITYLPTMAVMAVTGGFAQITNPEAIPTGSQLVMQQVLGMAVSVLTTPFMAAVVVLLYFDRRVRTEALDVQMMADRLAVAGD